MENRHGLAVDVETTQASGTAEWDAARTMVAHTVTKPATLGADKWYDVAEFVAAMRETKVTPHVAQKARNPFRNRFWRNAGR